MSSFRKLAKQHLRIGLHKKDKDEAELEKNEKESTNHNHHHHHHENQHHFHFNNHKIDLNKAALHELNQHKLDHTKITDTTDFDSSVAYEAFKACICADEVNVDLPQFIVAYRELIKFVNMLGRIFGFVSWELNDKCGNVDRCISKDFEHYRTVESAVEYEKATNIHTIHKNTTVSLLRLMRGLDFIRRLVEIMYVEYDSDKKLNELAYTVYENTLAFRHKWAIRHLVRVGMHLMPSKEETVELILKTAPKPNHIRESDSIFEDFILVLNQVYNLVHRTYAENDFLELVFV